MSVAALPRRISHARNVSTRPIGAYSEKIRYWAVKYATRLQLAVKIDKGELSEQEAQAQFAAAMAQLQMQAAAHQQAAMADFGNRLERAGAYLQQAGAPPAMPPPPVIPQQTRCSFWNNQMVCN
jgi:hypothetical protein